MESVIQGEVPNAPYLLSQIAGVVVLLVFANAFEILVGGQTKLIRIDHHDPSGHPLASVFAVSSGLGWGGIDGEHRHEFGSVIRRGELVHGSCLTFS
ncbi:MAG: hypothetical protein ABGX07_17435 [Pirellulaceae bacterium]